MSSVLHIIYFITGLVDGHGWMDLTAQIWINKIRLQLSDGPEQFFIFFFIFSFHIFELKRYHYFLRTISFAHTHTHRKQFALSFQIEFTAKKPEKKIKKKLR